MTRFNFVNYIDVPVNEYIRMIFDPAEDEVSDLTKLPNVSQREEIERSEDEKNVSVVVRYSAIGFIPPQIRQFLKPHMLAWYEHSTYKKAEKAWDWWVEPCYFKDIVSCSGRMSLHADGHRTQRVTRGKVSIRLPVVGEMAERILIDYLGKSIDVEVKMFHDMLRRLRVKRAKV
jgi:hypothetical protein